MCFVMTVLAMAMIVLISVILFALLLGFAPIIADIVECIGETITDVVGWIEDILSNQKRRILNMELIVFLKNGETLKFENVSNVRFSTNFFTVLCFDYLSASNHKKKSAAFNYVHLAGVSFEEELVDVDSLFKA